MVVVFLLVLRETCAIRRKRQSLLKLALAQVQEMTLHGGRFISGPSPRQVVFMASLLIMSPRRIQRNPSHLIEQVCRYRVKERDGPSLKSVVRHHVHLRLGDI